MLLYCLSAMNKIAESYRRSGKKEQDLKEVMSEFIENKTPINPKSSAAVESML